MLRKGARGLFNGGLARSKLASTLSRSFHIEKIRKLDNSHGGMVKIEADGVKETLKELEKKADFHDKINSAKRKSKTKEEMRYETSKAIALFKEVSQEAIRQGEKHFMTFICFSNKGYVSKVDLSGDIPKVHVNVTGGHLAFIYHDANFKAHLVISKIRKNIFQHIKKPEDYTQTMKINGKPIQLIYEKQDFVNELDYQNDDRVKNTWLIAEGDNIFTWQLRGTIGVVTHIAGSDTNIDFANLVSKGEMRIKDNLEYDRQRDACPHPIIDTILDENDILTLDKQDILTSLSPEDALGIILERIFPSSQIKEEYVDFFQDIVGNEGFLADLRQQISHLDELKSYFDNNIQTSATSTFK